MTTAAIWIHDEHEYKRKAEMKRQGQCLMSERLLRSGKGRLGSIASAQIRQRYRCIDLRSSVVVYSPIES